MEPSDKWCPLGSSGTNAVLVSDMDKRDVDMDSEMCGGVTCWRKRWGIQRDLHGLERWDCVDLMKFNKVKDKILPLGWHNSRLGDEWSSLEEKKLGVLVDGKLNRSDSISDEGRLIDVIYLDFITI